MAEQVQASSSSSPSTSRINNGESSSATATSSSSSNSSQVRQEEDEHGQHQHRHHHEFPHPEIENLQNGISFRGNVFAFDESSSLMREDTWSCVIVVLTFWFFVSMTLILGVYGSTTLRLGPNTSLLLQPNPIFVQSIKVTNLNESKSGPMLYGFYKIPELDIATTWSETRNVSIEADSHQEWAYFFNEGSQIDISYSVISLSSSLFLIIAKGNEGLAQWLEDPTYPNTTLSWNVVHGSGKILVDIHKPSSYYVAVGNLNSEEVKVQLNLSIRAIIYNTTDAYYKCSLTNEQCGLNVVFPEGNAGLLTSPGPEQAINDNWYVTLSYGPRWATYIVGIGALTSLVLVGLNFLDKFRRTHEDGTRNHYGEAESVRAPLISYKDDDLSSWGSSYDSLSHDEEDPEDSLVGGSLEGLIKDDDNNTRRLCAICFDAPRDCFFLPCGHCVACFACGTRIAEAAGTCPICRRKMKKVRKIFTV